MLRFVIAALAASFMSFSALASQCPSIAAQVQAALDNDKVSAENQEQVTALLEQGMAAHEAGNHGESVELLNQAMVLVEQ